MLKNILQAVRYRGGLRGSMRYLLQRVRAEGLSGMSQRIGNASRFGAPTPMPELPPPRHPVQALPAEVQAAKPESALQRLRRAQGEPGVLLVGHPYHIMGVSQVLRSAAGALDAAGIPFHICPVFGDYGRENLDQLKGFRFWDRVSETARHPVNIFFLNADQMQETAQRLGEGLFRNHYNVGIWHWELSRFPDAWRGALDYVDELWAPSRFIQQCLANATDKPVYRMPNAVQPETQAYLSRADLGLDEGRFLFLFFFDFRSYFTRKNPLGAIDAFEAAFPLGSRDDVQLVIKTNGLEKAAEWRERLTRRLAGDPDRYRIIDRVMSDGEIHELVRLTDCFVSLHRSEGFGFGMAEAMYYGKPVIATAYSGNLDFTNDLSALLVDHLLEPIQPGEYPFGEGAKWAYPFIDQAAAHMRSVVEDPGLRAAIGERGRAQVQTFLSYAGVGGIYRRYLDRIERMRCGTADPAYSRDNEMI